MKVLLVLSLFVAASSAWFLSKPTKPEWNSLYVTFLSFSKLPTDKDDALNDGWRLTKACDANNFFAGNRYVLDGDTAVMLLFGVNGQLAGIQMGIDKSIVGDRKGPWVLEGNMYVMTAYFTDPSTICSSKDKRKYYGDRLLIWNGADNSTIAIPFKEEDLAGTKWVAGKCFPMMGQHYWYDISNDMDCNDFYPVFIMYNGKRLNSFGWNTYGDLKSKRYEHPTKDKLGYFFDPKTAPKCLQTAGPLTTQHIYMDWPYNNLCKVGGR
ncbi:uncharacterized protein LOC116302857 [Actinia tenebrosa]|uniref:Uncharacterized protein LOC116302857 n=1 Tax=Actinia tenebrosa TaxID=6105 RepID=A0A6P8IM76_ACTTE|nr:uncharacterized protein LOC116302857 [Actinia tenebrosa]